MLLQQHLVLGGREFIGGQDFWAPSNPQTKYLTSRESNFKGFFGLNSYALKIYSWLKFHLTVEHLT